MKSLLGIGFRVTFYSAFVVVHLYCQRSTLGNVTLGVSIKIFPERQLRRKDPPELGDAVPWTGVLDGIKRRTTPEHQCSSLSAPCLGTQHDQLPHVPASTPSLPRWTLPSKCGPQYTPLPCIVSVRCFHTAARAMEQNKKTNMSESENMEFGNTEDQLSTPQVRSHYPVSIPQRFLEDPNSSLSCL